MRSRAEVTTRYAKAYRRAARKDKGRILDQVVEVTGWSRDNARRRLIAAADRPPGSGRQVGKAPRKQRSPKYSYDAVKVLPFGPTSSANAFCDSPTFINVCATNKIATCLIRRTTSPSLPCQIWRLKGVVDLVKVPHWWGHCDG